MNATDARMTAKEANDVANAAKLSKLETEVYPKIKANAKAGKFSLELYELDAIVMDALKKEGYKVQYFGGDFRDYNDRGYYKISWE
jgi:hypothetical protein